MPFWLALVELMGVGASHVEGLVSFTTVKHPNITILYLLLVFLMEQSLFCEGWQQFRSVLVFLGQRNITSTGTLSPTTEHPFSNIAIKSIEFFSCNWACIHFERLNKLY